MDNSHLPYIELAEFNRRVEEFAKDNHILKTLFSHPKSKVKTWEDLPPHLIQDLFKRLECKPHIEKY
jgi:hypothetical protein